MQDASANLNGLGKWVQDIHSPICEVVVAILGFTECGDLLSKDGEESSPSFESKSH